MKDGPREKDKDEVRDTALVAVRVPGKASGDGFYYHIPPELSGSVTVGSVVKVSFRGKTVDGYVIGFTDEAPVKETKPVLGIRDQETVPEELVRLAFWIRDRYLCSMGEAMGCVSPSRLAGRCTTERSLPRPAASLAGPGFVLTAEQQRAAEAIRSSIRAADGAVHLLHGVTGSGKTAVYFEGISEALELGKDVIVLLPEIALTPQSTALLRRRFGDIVSVWHSGMGERERREELNRICAGISKIVVGARSAVFAPVRSLGLVVVDEEHELTFKQQEAPRYNAKEVAFQRAREHGATVVLSSATPSVESYFAAKAGLYRRLTLSRRVAGPGLPPIHVVDMKGEDRTQGHQIFSGRLVEAIKSTVSSGRQVILFLNRRGYSPFVVCAECGYSLRCRQCNVSLTFHLSESLMYCHYCGFKSTPPARCPRCGGTGLRYLGTGTERVEREVGSICPGASVGRMDSDSLRRRGSHERVWQSFVRGELDILVGTQMVAKGLDVPRVTLVGVVLADTLLNIPDFRSAERTFQLLTQVAGRAGRGEWGGEVIIQTYNPEHYGISSAVSGDFDWFYEFELESRRELGFPPFAYLGLLRTVGRSEQGTKESAWLLAELCRELSKGVSVQVLGPAPCPFTRLRGKYRWQVLVKGEELEEFLWFLREVRRGFRGKSGTILSVDIDPVDML